MNATADLFDIPSSLVRQGLSIVPPSRRTDPHTSKQAAESMVQGASRHRASILMALKLYKEMTIYEIASLIGLSHVQVARRTAELCKAGKIQRIVTGQVDGKDIFWTRNSPTGRACAVWQIVL
jgi:predicted ArsR family transcriptional regulator